MIISRIPTRRPALQRFLEAAGAAIDKHPWLPAAIAILLLVVVNS